MYRFRIKFYQTSEPNAQDNKTAIQVWIYLNNQREYLTSANITIPSCQWDVKKGKVKPNNAVGRLMNHRINTLRILIEDIYHQHEGDANLSVEQIKASYCDYVRTMADKAGVIAFFREYLENSKEVMNYDRHIRYVQVLGQFEGFVNTVYNLKDLDFTDLCSTVLMDFESYLRKVAGCSTQSTLAKRMSALRYLFGAAYELGMLSNDPFDGYKSYKLTSINNDFLTIDEIKRLRNAVFKTRRLERVRDCFLFACYTGLSYSETKALTASSLIRLNGGTWILLEGQTEDAKRYIPLLPYPASIIEKYKDEQRNSCLLPMISQQKMNKYLKEIAELWEIDKRLTFQLAVRSFIKIALYAGASIDTVTHMLGQSIRKAEAMAKFSPKRIEDEMALFATKMGKNHPLAP